MSSRADRRIRRTAAWRLALPGVLVFGLGSAVVMGLGYGLLSESIRTRGDAWLEAEVESIAEGARAAPGPVGSAELAIEMREMELHEGLDRDSGEVETEGVFFLAVMAPGGGIEALAKHGPRAALDEAVRASAARPDSTTWVRLPQREYPLRVVSREIGDGRRVVGGATPYADAELLEEVRTAAIVGWAVMLLVGVPVVWSEVRRVLRRVDRLTDVAATISADALTTRLPEGRGGDEIDRLASTFNALLDRAADAAEQLRTMADAMAHDLRTPLAALRGTLEGARDESDASVARSGVEAAIGEVDDLTALVGATLDSAEAEAGALRLRRAPLDLAELVRDVADLYQPAAADHELELTVAADEPVEIVGDAGLLRRVAINLFDNALAHLPAGAHVRVTVVADSGRAVLELRDDGPGFPVEIRGRAFERLVRGAGSSGRGLGLASVRAVAVAHGGRAALDHPAGGGSVVRVELPV